MNWKMKCLKFFGLNTSFEHETPQDFVTSQWQRKEQSIAYLAYRITVACFFIFSTLTSLATAAFRSELHVYLIYLTHWNLFFTTIAMILSAVLVTLHHKGRLKCDKMTRELKTLWFLSSSSCMYAFLISLIYWTVLFKAEHAKIDLNNILVHATNSLVPLIDLWVVRQPPRFGIFVYPVGCGFIFLFFSWLYPALGGLNK